MCIMAYIFFNLSTNGKQAVIYVQRLVMLFFLLNFMPFFNHNKTAQRCSMLNKRSITYGVFLLIHYKCLVSNRQIAET